MRGEGIARPPRPRANGERALLRAENPMPLCVCYSNEARALILPPDTARARGRHAGSVVVHVHDVHLQRHHRRELQRDPCGKRQESRIRPCDVRLRRVQ